MTTWHGGDPTEYDPEPDGPNVTVAQHAAANRELRDRVAEALWAFHYRVKPEAPWVEQPDYEKRAWLSKADAALAVVPPHTVEDIEPSTETAELSTLWDNVGLVRTPPGTAPLIRVFSGSGDDFSPAEARQLAAELLSAAARAERTTPMLQSPSEANTVD